MITALYRRAIKPGTQYNDLIPSSQCESEFKGNGDTYRSMNLIKEFIEDYSYQVSKLAPLLKGKSLPETVNNIYDFLYWHLQYKADGAAQEIRSPQCAWHSRDRGTDCKSFSVFAGAILRELGIPFSIRKIQQPGDPKGVFSHVYIIVPQKNKPHLVIDATKHENTESIFINKYDIKMKHYGLNASVVDRQLHCAFHDYFGKICSNITSQGASNRNVATMQQKVNNHITKYGAYPWVVVEVDTVYIDTKPYQFRNDQGGTILVATKAGLNSAVVEAGAEIASDAMKDAVPKILAKVKGKVGQIWKSVTCKLRNSAWTDRMVKDYQNAIDNYFTNILNKFANSPDSYFIPNSLGESPFTKDFNYHILEFWSENAKYEFENNTYGQKHNSCTKIAREAVIRATEEYFAGIQELYNDVKKVYPFQHHMTVRSPLMNFRFNDLWNMEQTVNEARKKGYNNAIPQLQLPQITVNLTELEKMNNPRPDYDFSQGGSLVTQTPGTGSTPNPDIKNPGISDGFSQTSSSINTDNTGKINTSNTPKQAGFGLLPAVIIAAAGYGVYKSQTGKKKKKK